MPFVPDAESMLKLALCGSVKDTVVPPTNLVDYLLYHINKIDPKMYGKYCEPTNDVVELLDAVAQKTGRLQKGGAGDTEAAALWILQRWRTGHLGNFVLDDVSMESLDRKKTEEPETSVSQAKKMAKQAKAKLRAKQNAK
jgi:ribosome biogenesis GTPase A